MLKSNMPHRRMLPLFAIAVSLATLARGAESEALKHFEQKVRPILVARCSKCHAGAQAKGDFRLDSREGLLEGGASGPAIVPGHPDESLLVEAIRYESFEMPPEEPLPEAEVAVLEAWIRDGAVWPEGELLPSPRADHARDFTSEEKSYWAFQPLTKPALPEVIQREWCSNEIDRFILATLESTGIEPAEPADRRTLIRRLSFDLRGLPPALDEVEAFLNDSRPDAYERLVDVMLASPAYGERWGRHWLDLVRYAESDGFRKDDFRPEAWRYRDYVIESFNQDKPYDHFVREQLAGDLLESDDPWVKVATGFFRHGVYEYNQRDACTQRDDMYNEITDVVGDVFLGLGFGCARCHDHKFDPLLQEDYYKLQAFFTGMVPRDDVPVATAAQLAEYYRKLAAWESATASIRAKIEAIEGPHRHALMQAAAGRFPFDVQAMYAKPPAERTSIEAQVSDLVERQGLETLPNLEKRIKEPIRTEWTALHTELASFESLRPPLLPTTRGVEHWRGTIAPTRIPKSDRAVEPGYPKILLEIQEGLASPAPDAATSPRVQLAEWLTRPDHPLTARVIVNRVWHYHFGKGLVESTSDFGRLGQPPSHPELLDWLACQFIEDGWSFKRLHRRIVCSQTYQQTSLREAPELASRVDPQNRLLWRYRLRRLDAESIRDSLLAISGELDAKMGGPSVEAKSPRRSIYTRQKRNTRDPVLAAFDAPEMISSTPERNITTTSLQALLLANGSWTIERAQKLSAQIQQEGGTARQQVENLYRRLFAREPTSTEVETSLTFLDRQARLFEAEEGWRQIADQSPIDGRDAKALYFANEKTDRQIGLSGSVLEGADGFTVEAVVRLESLYEDASVRVIAAQWDGSKEHPGWSVGVTSSKSAFKPRNLIVQLVGEDAKGKRTYEVVASNLFLELDHPYRVSVAVSFDRKDPHVRFRLQSAIDPKSPPVEARVATRVVGGAIASSNIVLAGRPNQSRHRWHGHMETLLIAARPRSSRVFAGEYSAADGVIGRWDFGSKDPLADVTASGRRLQVFPSGESSPENAAWNDLCQVLLTSSELFYVD